MKNQSINDLLRMAESAVKVGSMVDTANTTRMKIGVLSSSASKHELTTAQIVSKFISNVHDENDMRVGSDVRGDEVFLHDVYAAMNHIYRDKKSVSANDAEFPGDTAAIITRARALRVSLIPEQAMVSPGRTIKGYTLTKLVRSGYDALIVMDLLYSINALSMAGSEESEVTKVFKTLFPSSDTDFNSIKKKIEGLMALATLIPASAVADAVKISNILTGNMDYSSDVDSSLQNYARAISLVTRD